MKSEGCNAYAGIITAALRKGQPELPPGYGFVGQTQQKTHRAPVLSDCGQAAVAFARLSCLEPAC